MDDNITEMKYDAPIAVLNTKVESLMDKQKELTERVRANEKVVAALGLLGTVTIAFIGAGYFVPKVQAMPKHTANEWIQQLRNWKSEQDRLSVEQVLNNALAEVEMDYGSDDPPKQKKLLQFPGNINRQSP